MSSPRLVSLEKIPLKNNPLINEAIIQEYIYNNPSVLGLGNLYPISREKAQPSGGRLDMMLASEDGKTRYEVEIQLGATDPSHIIRTLEYWDNERKRYPSVNHIAVIIAEEINGRFMNVISLFNGTVPIYALQLSVLKTKDDYAIFFTKVVKPIEQKNEEETKEEKKDRNYWDRRTPAEILKMVDSVWEDILASNPELSAYTFNYTQNYIGLSKGGIAKNIVAFHPKNQYMYLRTKADEDPALMQKLEERGLDVSYLNVWNQYSIKIKSLDEYTKNKDLFDEIVKTSIEYLG